MIPWIMVILCTCSAFCLIRVIWGPSLLDRIAAADAIGLLMTMILVLLGLTTGRAIFLDIALVYGILLFADLLVVARYLERGEKEK